MRISRRLTYPGRFALVASLPRNATSLRPSEIMQKPAQKIEMAAAPAIKTFQANTPCRFEKPIATNMNNVSKPESTRFRTYLAISPMIVPLRVYTR